MYWHWLFKSAQPSLIWLSDSYLVLIHLFPREVDESHLDSFALDAIDEAVTDGAAHDEEEGEPGDWGRGPRPGQGLVQDLSGEYSQQTRSGRTSEVTSHLIK